jgi:delta 1-pyrroline-5-carboxylate dehydrogenase
MKGLHAVEVRDRKSNWLTGREKYECAVNMLIFFKHNRHLRYKAINELADAFEANADRLKEILMLKNGKVAGEAMFEISLVVPKLRYYVARALTEFGRTLKPNPVSSVQECSVADIKHTY